MTAIDRDAALAALSADNERLRRQLADCPCQQQADVGVDHLPPEQVQG